MQFTDIRWFFPAKITSGRNLIAMVHRTDVFESGKKAIYTPTKKSCTPFSMQLFLIKYTLNTNCQLPALPVLSLNELVSIVEVGHVHIGSVP